MGDVTKKGRVNGNEHSISIPIEIICNRPVIEVVAVRTDKKSHVEKSVVFIEVLLDSFLLECREGPAAEK